MQQDAQQTPLDNTHDLLDFVAYRDVPCPKCAYNLRGLTQPQCPECGHSLVLGVGYRQPKQGLWLLGLVALLLMAGGGTLILIDSIQHGSYNYYTAGQVAVLVMSMIAFPLFISALLFRRRFISLHPLIQHTIAWHCVLAEGVYLWLFVWQYM